MSQICIGLIQLGQFKEATDMLRDISALVKENLSDDDPFYNELYTIYGQLAHYLKDYPKALKYYKDALKVAEDHSDQNAIRSIVMCTAVTLSKMG